MNEYSKMKIIHLGVGSYTEIQEIFNYIFKKARLKYRFESTGRSFGNAGDTAVRDSFRYMFKKEFPGSKVQFMDCRKIFNKTDIDRINKADVLFVSGHGMFIYDSFPNTVSDWQWGISSELLEEIKIPIVVYSVGFNRFRGQLDFNENFNKTVTKLIEKSIFFSLRNSGSCNAIKKYAPQRLHEHIKLNYCPTLLFNEAFAINTKLLRSNSVGFVLGGDRLKNRHKNLYKYIDHIKKFVTYLNRKGKTTILVTHNFDDAWIGRYIKFDRQIDFGKKGSEFIYKTYSTIDVVVGDKGHSQMIPFACGCKIISPISHDKVKWFLDDMGLQEYGIDESDDYLAEKLIEKYEKISTLNWQTIHQEKMQMIYDTNKQNLLFIKEKIKNFNGITTQI